MTSYLFLNDLLSRRSKQVGAIQAIRQAINYPVDRTSLLKFLIIFAVVFLQLEVG
ncbi:MAG: hypothetical protein P8R02_00125 [Pseudomonadales bacterium]|jgi:hypothetical protein|nr:hypothetical protein [Pseudomonadales bacterium]